MLLYIYFFGNLFWVSAQPVEISPIDNGLLMTPFLDVQLIGAYWRMYILLSEPDVPSDVDMATDIRSATSLLEQARHIPPALSADAMEQFEL